MTNNETTALDEARYLKLVQALLENQTVEAAVKVAGMSRTTAYRWLSEPAFQRLYRAARQRLVTHTIGRLNQLGHKALVALDEVLSDPQSGAAPRVAAARAVLDLLLRAADLDLLEARVTELEAAVSDSNVIEGQVQP